MYTSRQTDTLAQDMKNSKKNILQQKWDHFLCKQQAAGANSVSYSSSRDPDGGVIQNEESQQCPSGHSDWFLNRHASCWPCGPWRYARQGGCLFGGRVGGSSDPLFVHTQEDPLQEKYAVRDVCILAQRYM